MNLPIFIVINISSSYWMSLNYCKLQLQNRIILSKEKNIQKCEKKKK